MHPVSFLLSQSMEQMGLLDHIRVETELYYY